MKKLSITEQKNVNGGAICYIITKYMGSVTRHRIYLNGRLISNHLDYYKGYSRPWYKYGR